jgi:hypothetical protein
MCANECAHEDASLASSAPPADDADEAEAEAEAAAAPLPAGFSSFLAAAAPDDEAPDDEAAAALAAATAAAPPSAASVHHSVSTSFAPHGLSAASASSEATPAARV